MKRLTILLILIASFGATVRAGEDAYDQQQESQAQMESDEAGVTIKNWQYANVHDVFITSTPNTPGSYIWHEETNLAQGVWVSLISVKSTDIYLQQNNGWLRFNTLRYGFFTRLEVRYDGGSWKTIVDNNTKDASKWVQPSFIGQLGSHTLEMKWWDVAGYSYYRSHTVVVVPAAQKLYMDNYGNVLTLWDGSSSGLPIMLSEGIDPYNTTGAERLRSIGNDLMTQLLQRGSRIYLLNYRWGGQSLRNNGAVYHSAVQWISSLNANKKIIASGMSMGGVIARYALAKAEGAGTPLNVSKFFSIDSPQQGANIHTGLQSFMKDPPDCIVETRGKTFQVYGVSCDAARELLNYSAFDNGAAHTAFFNELNQLNGNGYPHLTKNIGVTFSNGQPNSNPVNTQYIKVKWTGIAGLDICGFTKTFNLESALTQPGSYLPKSLTDGPAKQVYWGSLTITRYCDATFIPYTSALDLVNSQSKFNMTIAASVKNYYHDEVPPEIVTPIVNEIFPPQPFVVGIEGPSYVRKGGTGTWVADVSGGVGGYTYQWWINSGGVISTGSSVSAQVSYDWTLYLRVTSGSEIKTTSMDVHVDYGTGGGGCPFVFVKSDSGWTVDNNILHRSEFQENRGKDIIDLYKLAVKPKKENNYYHLKVKELNNDHSYLDRFKLYSVDHPAGTEIAISENNEIYVFDPNNVASVREAKIYDQTLTDFVQFLPNRDGISGIKKQSLKVNFPSQLKNEEAIYSLKNTYGKSSDKENTILIMNPGGISAQLVPKEYAATIQSEAMSSSNPLTFSRRERQSMVAVTTDRTLLSGELTINWNRNFSLSYIGATKALSGAYVKQELFLDQAYHSLNGNVKSFLSSKDTKYAELDAQESIELLFKSGAEVKRGWVRDFVIEVEGRYELPTFSLSKTERTINKNQSGESNDLPTRFELGNNYPNPFNPSTTISYAIPRREKVSLKVYDILGREVIELVNATQAAGSYSINFDASKLTSGVYIYRLQAGSFVSSKRMLLVK